MGRLLLLHRCAPASAHTAKTTSPARSTCCRRGGYSINTTGTTGTTYATSASGTASSSVNCSGGKTAGSAANCLVDGRRDSLTSYSRRTARATRTTTPSRADICR